MTYPNALTLLRIFLVPAFLIAVIYDRLAVALGFFLLAAATDLLDGFLARRLGQKTVLGTYLDPLADKLLMAVCFISLAAARLLPAWLAVLAVTKDLFVSLGVGILGLLGRRLLPDGSCACLLSGFGSRSFEAGSSTAQRHWGHVC